MIHGILFVVATPLGNLEDLSPRGVRVLSECDRIACEDTRHTQKLLNHFGITTPTLSYHEHNEEARSAELLEGLERGDKIALVSDAGTPLVSDPGYHLVRACRERGIPVVPVPGPSAALAALSVSGLPTDRFLFVGFLPKKKSACRQELEKLAGIQSTLIFYLAPHGLKEVMETVRQVLGDRRAFLIREMTKLHETAYYGSLDRIAGQIREEDPRGEYTLVVEGAREPEPEGLEVDVAAYVAGLMQTRGLSQRDAIREAARDLGLPRNEVYRRVVQGKD